MILHIPFAMSSILSWAIDLLFSFLRLLSFFFRCVCFVETVKNSLSMTPRQNRDQKRSDVTVDSHLKKLSICGFHRPCCRNTFNFSRIDLSLTFTQPLPSVSDIWVNVSTRMGKNPLETISIVSDILQIADFYVLRIIVDINIEHQ